LAASVAVAASRLMRFVYSKSAGLRPQLSAVAAPRLQYRIHYTPSTRG
jgi:hypothetical protein